MVGFEMVDDQIVGSAAFEGLLQLGQPFPALTGIGRVEHGDLGVNHKV